jgi:uncharacterized protein
MFLDLTQIRQPETPVVREYPAEAFANEDGYRVVEAVRLSATVHKDDTRFRVEGRLHTQLELDCSRCVEPLVVPVDTAFDLRFLPQTLADDREVDPDKDPSTTFYSDDRIDLGQIVREQCYLTLPMKPLCRPDCKGLCPMCGTNLNTERCDCDPRWVDPRLAGLQALISPRTNDDA